VPEPPLNGRVEAIPPDRFRIEGTSEANGQEVKMLIVMNGPQMWMEMRDAASDEVQQVVKMDLGAMPGAPAESPSPTGSTSPDVTNVLSELSKTVAFESVRDETLDGEPCKVFEGKSLEADAGPETLRVWIGTSDGLVRRMQRADASGNVTEDLRVTNMETNPPLPLSRFEYTPPVGVPVMDMGEMLKQMMEGMGEAMGAAVEEAAAEENVAPEEDEGVAPEEAEEMVSEEDEDAAPEEEEEDAPEDEPVLRDIGARQRNR
jgi:outer membrane lipoprotein-sorting protein